MQHFFECRHLENRTTKKRIESEDEEVYGSLWTELSLIPQGCVEEGEDPEGTEGFIYAAKRNTLYR